MRALLSATLLGALLWLTFPLLGCNGPITATPETANNGPNPAPPVPPGVNLVSLQVTPGESSLALGTTEQLKATGAFSDHSTRDLTGQVTWGSNNAAVAGVSNTGRVTPQSEGTATLTAALDGVVGTATVTVHNAVLTRIAVTPANPTIAVDTSVQLKATGTFSDPETHDPSTQDLTGQVTWTSSNAAVASVNGSGRASGLSAGASTLTATLGAVSGSTVLTVRAATLTGITVAPAAGTVEVGHKARFTATGTFSDGTTQDLTDQVTWTSTAPASIDSLGVATGISAGVATVTAARGALQATARLTVTVAPLIRIDVTPTGQSLLDGTRLQMKATGFFQDGSSRDLTDVASWSTSPTGIASVSDTGLVTGVNPGPTAIRAASNGVLGSAPLTVTPVPTPGPKPVPDPPATDPRYFQVLIDARTTQPVHLTYTASKLQLTSPTIEGITWLTGGGPNFDDFNNPVMQLVDSSKGVTGGAQFASTYDITLNQLPLDPTGNFRVLKIPYLDPNDATRSLAGSGHLTITLNQKAVIQINGSGPFAFALPSPDPNGAGGQTRWDFVEINGATPAVSGQNVCFVNTTNVDFFSLGLLIKGRSAGTTTLTTFGLDLTGDKPVTSLITALEALPGNYTLGKTVDGNGNFLRFRAPDLAFPANATELDNAIRNGYTQYATTALSFKVGPTQYTATTTGAGVLTFTAPKSFAIGPPLPTTLNAIAATGPLNTGSTGDAQIQDAMKFIAAALNRGIFQNTALWNTPGAWYPAGVEHNEYAHLLHNRFVNAACYAFSFDDVPGDVVSAPAIGACTSMTLVITDK